MSKLQVQGNASGSGVVTLAAPNTNSDVTLSLPARTGGVMVDGPAFSAYQSSAQSYTSTVFTKLQFQTEEFDTASCFDNVTNYRFTPTVAGYYQINGGANIAIGSAQEMIVFVYKNGAAFKILQNVVGVLNRGCYGSTLVYLNGTTDYVELYVYVNASGTVSTGVSNTYFQGCLVRAA
jgi:hypothetical protein